MLNQIVVVVVVVVDVPSVVVVVAFAVSNGAAVVWVGKYQYVKM